MSKCCDKKKKHHKSRIKKECRPNNVAVACENLPGATAIPAVDITTTEPIPRTVGSASIDLSCFKKPCVTVAFNGLLIYPVGLTVASIVTFRLFRQCNDSPEIEIGSFDIPSLVAVTTGETRNATFTVCDCPTCPSSCCTYRVEVEADALAALTTGAAVSVTNASLSIIASDNC